MPAGTSTADAGVIETDIAPRLDRLPWDRFHTLVVVALGITWILDGLEVTLAGSVSGALKASPTSALLKRSTGLVLSAPATVPASVTSSPSRIQVIPSATTTRAAFASAIASQDTPHLAEPRRCGQGLGRSGSLRIL